ncbi:MAG: class I tRNA ligase family protein [Patescibacteria group bacterium]
MKKKPRTYDHISLEKKWQKYWEKKKVYKTKDLSKKFYVLDMFPYPSGEGLHVGHPKGYIATDVVSRMKRMQGYGVLHPMGFDAFGLPAENYAIKTKTNPQIAVKKNVERYKEQLEILGFDYDWEREVNTTDPEYYRWTQWIFLQLFKKGLAYESYEPINWCPVDKTGLANEDIEDGKCERCGAVVEKRPMRQWVLKITDYADKLLSDLDLKDINGDPLLEWPESIKELQRNWIGRSEGVNFKCWIKDLNIEVKMYNSVPQTYRAETFTVIAPEHPLVNDLIKGTEYEKPVLEFVEKIKAKKANNKFDIDKDMEGIFTGRYIRDFAGTGRDLPIWVASYVLADYGTGMVNCSAHDERDYAFAKKYNLPLHEVVEPFVQVTTGDDAVRKDMPFVERNAVICVVKHWSEDKYLCLHWKAVEWRGFVVGGIEDGESAESAAMREVVEETGYKNVRFVKTLGGKIHSQFYQAVKKVNRFAHFTPVLMELIDGEQNEIAEEEKALHTLEWVSKDKVMDFVNKNDLKITWSRVIGAEKPIVKNGILLEPKEFKGREWKEVREDIIDYLVKSGYATRKINYKIRDWVFSRQRYWGEPIPVIHCEKCGVVPVPEKDLPVKLPKVKFYEPTGTGESPLAAIDSWVNVKCPKCKGKAKRETNTMPQWAGSSWYYLRYIDPKNSKAFVDKKKEKNWMPVDLYVGGAEHATRHLIYARFWHKFLYDLGEVSTPEPFKKLQSVGLIMGEDDRKMSKRWGNVVNPDDVIKIYGADTLRVYEMFMGPFDQAISWSTDNMIGSRRFIERVWKLSAKVTPNESKALDPIIHKTIKKVTEDIDAMKFNTAVSTMMIAVNEFEKAETISREHYEMLIKLLAPFAPHITDELWTELGNKQSIHISMWPQYNATKITETTQQMAVQINGKVRANIVSRADASDEEIKKLALGHNDVAKWLDGKEIMKVIIVKNKLVNIVVKA